MRRAPALASDARGTAAIEFALVLPIMLLILFGAVTYGGWIALNHAVQQGANEAARAAMAGLTPGERAALARRAAEVALQRSWRIAPSDLTVSVDDDGTVLTTSVSYDARGSALLSLPIVPLPDRVIVRRAAVRLGTL